MSSQSERIRAVLARSEAPRFDREPDTPSIAVNTDNLEAFLRSEPAPAQPVMVEPVAEVEEFLPLISVNDAASDRARAAHQEIPLPPRFVAAREKQNRGIPPVVLVFGGLGALAVLAGVLVFAMKDRWLSAAPAPVATATPLATEGSSFPFQVKAEPQGNGLIDIRWNPQSSQVAQAREGRLVITEHDQPARVVDLSPDQLKIGHVSYQAQTERLEFRLEVVDQNGASTAESVLALSTKPASAPQTQPLPMAKAPDPLEPVRQAARPFTPPVPAQTSTPEVRAMVLDPPAAVPIGTTGAPGPDVRQTMTNLPAAPVKPAPLPAQAPAAPLRTGGKIQPPVLLKKISPAYPQLARVGHIQGDVRFTATIGKDGKVQNLQVVSGPPALISAAREAVKQWVYQPSLLNGEPLEVTTEIDVNFTLGQ